MNFDSKILTQFFNKVLDSLDEDTSKELEYIHNNNQTNTSPNFLSGNILNAIQQEGKLFGFNEVSDYQFEATPLQSALFSLFINTYTPFGYDLEDIEDELKPRKFIVGGKDHSLPFVGGSRQGTLNDVPYNEIRHHFGPPTYAEPSADGKVQAEWDIKFDNGVRASIYDYKQYHHPPELVTDWSIGGNSPHSAYEVYKVMGIL